MKSVTCLLLAWALWPLTANSQSQNRKWKTELSVRSMVSGLWKKDHGFHFPGFRSKPAFSFGLQGGKSLALKPGWRLFFGLGYAQFGFRSESDRRIDRRLSGSKSYYTTHYRWHLLDVPVRLDYHPDSRESGWVFGLGLTPSGYFGLSWNYTFGTSRSSGTEFFSPKEFFLSAEVQAGRVWSLGKRYALDTRLLVFGDPYRFGSLTSNRVGIGLQVGFLW